MGQISKQARPYLRVPERQREMVVSGFNCHEGLISTQCRPNQRGQVLIFTDSYISSSLSAFEQDCVTPHAWLAVHQIFEADMAIPALRSSSAVMLHILDNILSESLKDPPSRDAASAAQDALRLSLALRIENLPFPISKAWQETEQNIDGLVSVVLCRDRLKSMLRMGAEGSGRSLSSSPGSNIHMIMTDQKELYPWLKRISYWAELSQGKMNKSVMFAEDVSMLCREMRGLFSISVIPFMIMHSAPERAVSLLAEAGQLSNGRVVFAAYKNDDFTRQAVSSAYSSMGPWMPAHYLYGEDDIRSLCSRSGLVIKESRPAGLPDIINIIETQAPEGRYGNPGL
ncbi:MAG: hypothetical protein ACP5NX_01380 [Candidatus Bilamarchaeaceae archaeon]